MNLRIPAFAMTMMICAGLAQAQSLSATSIEIDISGTETGAEPFLIAAYLPQTGVAPTVNGFDQTVTRVAFSADAGLPAPSIILGRVEAGQEDVFGIETLMPATIEQIGFDYTNLEARIALRADNPELFRKLIEQGHVDPPADQLNRVLQTELARMNCYRSGIDGAWGPGSRRSVAAYYDEIEGANESDQEPSVDLFRTMILREDVACPTPVAAAPSAATTTRRTTASQPARTASRPATTSRPATVAAQKPASTPKITTGAGIGVFR